MTRKGMIISGFRVTGWGICEVLYYQLYRLIIYVGCLGER